MQFQIQREDFLSLLKKVSGLAERRQEQQTLILSHVLLQVRKEGVLLTTTDKEVLLSAFCKFGDGVGQSSVLGLVSVSFRRLYEVCRVLPEKALLSIKSEKNRVVLLSGKSRFAFSTLPVDQFPVLEKLLEASSFVFYQNQLRALLDRSAFSMADQDVRCYLNGMLLDYREGELHAVAANGHRLAMGKLTLEEPIDKPFKVVVPKKGILALHRSLEDNEQPVTLTIGPRYLQATTENTTLIVRLLDAKFPDYQQLMRNKGHKNFVGKRLVLKDAFHRAAALFSEKGQGVRLNLCEGCLILVAVNAEQDEGREEIEVCYRGEEFEVVLNVQYVLDVLMAVASSDVQFTFSSQDAGVLLQGVGESGVYLIMPMKI